MANKIIFTAILFILVISFVNAVDIHLISPQQENIDFYPQSSNYCDVDWQCTNWGGCINGKIQRICEDANNCQFKYNQPVTELSCKENLKKQVKDTDSIKVFFGIFNALFLLILIIILTGLRRVYVQGTYVLGKTEN